MRYFLTGLFLICFTFASTQNWNIGGEFGVGKLFKHTEKLAFKAEPASYYAELQLNFKTSQEETWAKYYRFPTIQLIGRYQQYTANNLLGNSIGLYPAILFPVNKNRAYPITFTAGTGLTWSTKIYHRSELPLNNAIGSHLNNLSVLKLGFGLPVFYQWKTTLMLSMTHISNGSTKMPNLGLNTFYIGLRFSQQHPPNRVNINDKDPAVWKFRPWHFEAGSTIGLHQSIVIGGPLYTSFGVQAAVVRSLKPVQRLGAGFELEYNSERADFFLGSYDVDTRKAADWKATRFSFFLRYEFLFGPLGFGVTTGIYIKKEMAAFPVFNKLDLRYYFENNVKGSGIYLTIILKSHKANAAYLGGGAGYRF